MEKVPSEVFYIVFALIGVFISRKFLRYQTSRREVKSKIARKLEKTQRNYQLLEKSLTSNGTQLLNPKRKEIIELPIKQLLVNLQNGQLSCVDVLKAYQAKALEVTRDLNCVTEFISEAEEWAKKLDTDGGVNGKKGPLHGLPFSIKDNVALIGYDCTAGVSKFLDKPSTDDAALVVVLKSLGAIPFCKTNIPQTMLSVGCSNPVWGLTKNPHDKDRTPGGSSGGEGALVSAHGSPFGIGSDIGGSIRIPAAFCGVSSLKPTNFRFSYKGLMSAAVGCVGMKAVPGIIARDTETLLLLHKLLLTDNYHREFADPDVLPIPWNDSKFITERKLRIGYYDDDGYFPSTPGVRRAVQLARLRLQELGHELVPFTPPRVGEVVNSFTSLIGADRCKYLLEALDVDDIDPVLKMSMLGIRLPHFLKVLIKPILSFTAPRLVPLFMGSGGYRLQFSHQLWMEIKKQQDYKQEFLSQWRKLKLDLCLAPSFACPAPLSKDIGRLLPAFSYACLYNFIDFPSGILPVTKETDEDQAKLESDYQHNDIVCKLAKKSTKGATGMPITVQIIGLPYEEEMVLRGLQILDGAIRK